MAMIGAGQVKTVRSWRRLVEETNDIDQESDGQRQEYGHK